MELKKLGDNVVGAVEDGKLLLEIDLRKQGVESKSGNSVVIGSTRGNQTIAYGDRVIKVGVNIFQPK